MLFLDPPPSPPFSPPQVGEPTPDLLRLRGDSVRLLASCAPHLTRLRLGNLSADVGARALGEVLAKCRHLEVGEEEKRRGGVPPALAGGCVHKVPPLTGGS